MTKNLLRLAVAGFFVTACSLLHAAIPAAENLLPTDTIAFFSVPDCNALRAASKVSPQLMFWNDPAMKPFRDKFMGKFNEKFIAPLEKDLGLKADDFIGLLQGQFTFALTVNGSNGHDDVPPGLLVLLDAKDKSPQLKTNLDLLVKKMNDNGHAVRTQTIRSIPFNVVTLSTNDLSGIFGPRTPVSEIGKDQKPEKPVDIYFAQYQTLLIACDSASLADAVIAHLTGGSVPELANEANFSADRLSQFRNSPTYYGWFNGKVFFNLIAQAADSSDNDPAGIMPKFSVTKILAATGLNNLRSASFAMHEGRDGAAADFHISAPADTRAGLLKIIALPAKDASAPSFVPADAVKFMRARLDGKQTWADLQKMFADVSPQVLAYMNQIVDLANANAQEKDPSFDLNKNLFGNLGDDIISYSKAPLGDSLQAIANPPGLTLLATPNADQMIQAIKVIALLASSQQPPEPRDFHGHKIYTLPARPLQTASGTVPQPPVLLSSANGYVAITKDAGILEEFLRSGDANTKPLREIPGLADAAAHVGGTGTGFFTYQNQRESMRVSFKLFKNAMDSDPTMKMFPKEYREWIDFSLLPDYDQVSKYFYMSVISGITSPDGITVKVFNPRPPQLN